MAVLKLSQIASSPGNADANTVLVGVETTGPTDYLFTLAQLGGGMSHNPTATGGPAAVNGSATTFMRSDAAPAIQTATALQQGLVQVDGTTITIAAGTISTPGGANPTATASDTAVNGSAVTFMRSDGAPAVQKGSSSLFGIVKVDNSTITASAGVISAVQPAGANPTATASDVAVNGVATTFMRSDAAPAVQKTSASVFGLCKVDGTSITATGGVISATGGGGGSPGGSSGQIQYNNSGSFGGFGNWDGSANTELVNSTTAQTLRVYNTFTNSSNYERAIFDWNVTSNVLSIGPQHAGTGQSRAWQMIGGSNAVKWDWAVTTGADVLTGSVPIQCFTNGGSVAPCFISHDTRVSGKYLALGAGLGGSVFCFDKSSSGFFAIMADTGSAVAAINGTILNLVPGAGGFVVGAGSAGGSALATNATDGFLYIPTCAGTPTGTPTTQTGSVAMVYDTTNNKLYIYNGGWKGGTNPGTFT